MQPVTLNYRESGRGPTVVLLHGMLASGLYWEEIMSLLGQDFHVIAPDLLGFGHSPKPKDSDYSRDTHIETIISTLNKIGVKGQVVLVGHSMGALIALGLTVKYPHMVSKLILISMPVYKNKDEARREIIRSGIAPSWVYYGRAAKAICSTMCKFRPLLRLITPLLLSDFPKKIAQDTTLHTWHSYSKSMSAIIENQNVLEDLARLSVKPTVMFGTRDRLATQKNIKELRVNGINITLKLLNATHQLPLEKPSVVVASITD